MRYRTRNNDRWVPLDEIQRERPAHLGVARLPSPAQPEPTAVKGKIGKRDRLIISEEPVRPGRLNMTLFAHVSFLVTKFQDATRFVSPCSAHLHLSLLFLEFRLSKPQQFNA